MAPMHYDPSSPDEQPVPLPASAPRALARNVQLQLPLTRRGHGPGIILFLDAPLDLDAGTPDKERPLDPEPTQKWAEEGFAVVAVTAPSAQAASEGRGGAWSVRHALGAGIDTLQQVEQVDVKDKFAVIVYSPSSVQAVLDETSAHPLVACVIAYGASAARAPVPSLSHLPSNSSADAGAGSGAHSHTYATPDPAFVLPSARAYHARAAGLAHTRSLVFLRTHLGGPHFDLERIWDEHTRFEFDVRSVAKTMGTMVAEPYVNHVPTMTGGRGRAALTAFYRDHFIFSNPADFATELVSRTVGADRIVDEFIARFTHNRVIDWLMPGVPPSGNAIVLPMVSVVNIRGDRICHEHIWWDQGSALHQAGVLPWDGMVPSDDPQGYDTTITFPICDGRAASLLATGVGVMNGWIDDA